MRNLLSREGDFEIEEAADYEELARAVVEEMSDLALVDVDLPPGGGVEAIGRLFRLARTRFVLWSFDADRATLLAAVSAGATGHIEKSISSAGLVRTLRGALNGEAALSRLGTAELVDAFHGAEERDRARERAVVLSPREREVLALVAEGARNREIARKLVISEFTVKRHMQNILTKLELSSRGEAGMFYRSAFTNELEAVAAGMES